MLMTAAVVLFAGAASVGLTMAVLHFMGKSPPAMGLAMLHGLFVLPAFAVLWAALWPTFSGAAALALAIFGVAAIGGATMVLGWRAKPLPSALVLIHGGVALIGLAVLASAVLV